MGFTEVLTVIFVILKFTGTIDWSWWLVLLPEIIACGLYLVIVISGLLVSASARRSIDRLFENERKHTGRF